MSALIRPHFDEIKTHLLIDAMYFHAARKAHILAENCSKTIEEVKQRWDSLDQKYERILSEYDGDPHSAYDELEPIGIQMANVHDEIGVAYAPLLKEIAVVHILCAAALESHINSIAKDALKGNVIIHFERFNLEAKWIVLPKLLGFSGFDPGNEPFQGFHRLIKCRNSLVHYKGLKEGWVYGEAPKFIKELGLTLEDSKRSIESVENMIRELSRQRAIDEPYWLRSDVNEMSYFQLK